MQVLGLFVLSVRVYLSSSWQLTLRKRLHKGVLTCDPLGRVGAVRVLNTRHDLHPTGVERGEVAADVQNVKRRDAIRLPIQHFEVEPVSVAFRICVDLQNQVVRVQPLKINRVEVARLKIRVKL